MPPDLVLGSSWRECALRCMQGPAATLGPLELLGSKMKESSDHWIIWMFHKSIASILSNGFPSSWLLKGFQCFLGGLRTLTATFSQLAPSCSFSDENRFSEHLWNSSPKTTIYLLGTARRTLTDMSLRDDAWWLGIGWIEVIGSGGWIGIATIPTIPILPSGPDK